MALRNNFEAFAAFLLIVSTRARKMCVGYIMRVSIFGRVFRAHKYLASYDQDTHRTHVFCHVKRSKSLIDFTQKWEWLIYVRKIPSYQMSRISLQEFFQFIIFSSKE